MLILPELEVKEVLSMENVIEAVTRAYRDYSDRLVDVPARITMGIRGESDSAIFLAANYHSIPFYGLKQASSFPSNKYKGKNTVFSEIHLYSAETGELLAMISANHITALKTGAASAVATKVLARDDAGVLAIIGTGVQAKTQLVGVQFVRPIREVRLFDVDQGKVAEFVRFIGVNKNEDLLISVTDSAAECITGADIVVTATTSSIPVFSGDYIGEGVHINAVGSFTPDMQELDSKTVLKAAKIVTDQREAAWTLAGDLLVPLKGGLISDSILYAELGDIVAGKIPGRESEREITIYESLGFAALDIAVATAAYEKALVLGIGTKIKFYT